MRPLHLAMEDRRWLVPKVTETKQTPAYWIRLNDWLTKEDGLEIIYQWAKDFINEHGAVIAGADAPMTKAKQEMIYEGFSEGMKLVRDLAEEMVRMDNEDKMVMVTDRDVRVWLAKVQGMDTKSVKESLATIRKQLTAGGMRFVEEKTVKGVRSSYYVNFAEAVPDDIGCRFRKLHPLDSRSPANQNILLDVRNCLPFRPRAVRRLQVATTA